MSLGFSVLPLIDSVLNTPSFHFYMLNCNTPKPHSFQSKALHSETSILEIVSEVSRLLPQLSTFIEQFDTTVVKTGVNVMTDTAGNMSIDVPSNMPDAEVNKISTRLSIIDRLITTRGQEINSLIQKGLQLESTFKTKNPEYVSQLTDQIQEFRKLNASYKH
jgi:hypothetical protein